MINSKRGSVLTVTLGLVLIFSLFGVATIKHATVQNETTERRTSSVEALWLADAAVELARSKLNKLTPQLITSGDPIYTNTPLGDGDYTVFSALATDCIPGPCINRWDITSQASVVMNNVDGSTNTQSRGIFAKAAYYSINNAITTHGTVNGDCGVGGAATLVGGCAAYDDFTFETVFNGLSFDDLRGIAQSQSTTGPLFNPSVDREFHNTAGNQPFEVDEVGRASVIVPVAAPLPISK